MQHPMCYCNTIYLALQHKLIFPDKLINNVVKQHLWSVYGKLENYKWLP
jgi:hypothetical protein